MPRVDPVLWKNRQGYRISNGLIEMTVLLGGGHIADFRQCGFAVNALWEAPWTTIDPQNFASSEHARLYGEAPVGKFLSGYTGHALALGYFGMPLPDEAARGLPLHGEAASAAWDVTQVQEHRSFASLQLRADLPAYRLRVQRKMTIGSGALTLAIQETVSNQSEEVREIQWVQHSAFGEPLLAPRDASLYIPAERAKTWPLGYEGHEMLPDNCEFAWPIIESGDGRLADLSSAFQKHGTGFVASVLTRADRQQAFVAIYNRRMRLIAGYFFERKNFPWVALWEENCARTYPPWNGKTRVRGVEFGNTPMPLGLAYAQRTGTMFETPVLTAIGPRASMTIRYQMFLAPVPPAWNTIEDVGEDGNNLVICSDRGSLMLPSSVSSD